MSRPPPRNLKDERFGRLKVISREASPGERTLWLCLCDCGETTKVLAFNLTRPDGTRSCGCLRRELSGQRLSKRKRQPGAALLLLLLFSVPVRADVHQPQRVERTAPRVDPPALLLLAIGLLGAWWLGRPRKDD